MKHYDENIIELYLIGSKLVLNEREDIEQHLKECFSCKQIYENIFQFYSKIESADKLKESNEKQISTNSIIASPKISGYDSVINSIPKGIVSRSSYFLRANPVKTSLSFFGAIIIFFLGMNFKYLIADNNPVYTRSNDSNREVEIYNKDGNKLFGLYYNLPTGYNAGVELDEFNWNIKNTVIYDINDDGKNEIITVVPKLIEAGSSNNTLRVLNYKKETLFTRTVGDTCRYFNMAPYDNDYTTRGVIVYNSNGKTEILVGAFNNRSPYVITRFDCNGTKLGEYWHYGTIWGIHEVLWRGEKRIMLCGVNDLNEPKSMATISIIDPTLIDGKVQSIKTKGFIGMPEIAHEEFINFPWNGYNDLFERVKPRIVSLKQKISNSEFKFSYVLDPKHTEYGWNIVIDTNLVVKQLIPSDNFIRKYGKLDRKTIDLFSKRNSCIQ